MIVERLYYHLACEEVLTTAADKICFSKTGGIEVSVARIFFGIVYLGTTSQSQ